MRHAYWFSPKEEQRIPKEEQRLRLFAFLARPKPWEGKRILPDLTRRNDAHT